MPTKPLTFEDLSRAFDSLKAMQPAKPPTHRIDFKLLAKHGIGWSHMTEDQIILSPAGRRKALEVGAIVPI